MSLRWAPPQGQQGTPGAPSRAGGAPGSIGCMRGLPSEAEAAPSVERGGERLSWSGAGCSDPFQPCVPWCPRTQGSPASFPLHSTRHTLALPHLFPAGPLLPAWISALLPPPPPENLLGGATEPLLFPSTTLSVNALSLRHPEHLCPVAREPCPPHQTSVILSSPHLSFTSVSALSCPPPTSTLLLCLPPPQPICFSPGLEVWPVLFCPRGLLW